MAAPEAAAARAAIAASDCHRFLYGNTPTLTPPMYPSTQPSLSPSLSALSLVFVLMRFYFI